MGAFCIRVAGQVIQVSAVHEETRGFFRAFLTDEKPDICLQITEQDAAAERPSIAAAAAPGIDMACSAEIQAIFRKISEALVSRDIFLFHGAAISVGGRGFIFTGNSGIGKSTHILKWLAQCPDAVEINGDKPYILAGDSPLVYGSPWGGKERFSSDLSVPLEAIVLLERAEENHMHHASLPELFPALWQQTYRPQDTALARRTLHLLSTLCSAVSFWRFQCNNFKDDCFPTAYRALTGREP